MTSLRVIGDIDCLPHAWRRLRDEDRWPGRELEWVWCHPTLSLLIFQGLVFEAAVVVWPWATALVIMVIAAILAILLLAHAADA